VEYLLKDSSIFNKTAETLTGRQESKRDEDDIMFEQKYSRKEETVGCTPGYNIGQGNEIGEKCI
jgi:hypothetical protein